MIHPNDVGIIRYDYNHAKNKKEQVKILAQLYAVPRSEILGLLNIEEPEKRALAQGIADIATLEMIGANYGVVLDALEQNEEENEDEED